VDAERRLDERDQRPVRPDSPGEAGEGIGVLGLRQHDSDAGMPHDEGDVGRVPRRAGGVDPHDDGRAGGKGGREAVTGRILGPGRDGVLEVDDDGIGAARRCLGEALRPVGGNEERRRQPPALERRHRPPSSFAPAAPPAAPGSSLRIAGAVNRRSATAG
jgi:hypothetical protein